MCMSPHEMTSATIETRIQSLRGLLDAGEWQDGRKLTDWEINLYTGRIQNLEEILKERTDNGTYDTEGVADQW